MSHPSTAAISAALASCRVAGLDVPLGEVASFVELKPGEIGRAHV